MQDVRITLPVGTIVQERYYVKCLLGKGGFGAVYLVRDQRVKGNVFALKETVDSSKKERDRFTFEGEVLKRFDHPSLPRVYRTFDDEKNHRAYILMDYIDGPNLEVLRQRQPEKRFSLERALQIMAPIIDAIDYLHKQEPPIVHRDIKPSNIITPATGNNAVLVDFGIAKEYDVDATTTAIRRCSPGYGAPEQYASGTNPRTDIYGLGATFYALLTGKVPIDAVYRMTQIGSYNIDPLEPVTALAPEVPTHVANTILCALEIRSEDRFASIEEFWQALHAQPTETMPPAMEFAAAKSAPNTEEPFSAPGNTGTVTVRTRPTRSMHTRGIFIPLVAIVLLALLAGIVVGVDNGHFFSIGHTARVTTRTTPEAAHTSTARSQTTAIAHTHPTTTTHITPTATAYPTPTATHTTQPTAAPTQQASTAFPQLVTSYVGTIHNTPANVSTSMTLSQIQQNGASVDGQLALGQGLIAGSNAIGTVSHSNTIEFTVSSGSLAPLLFQGQIQSNGSITGTYCSYQGNQQCSQSAGGYGTWSVSPSSSTSAQAYQEHTVLQERRTVA